MSNWNSEDVSRVMGKLDLERNPWRVVETKNMDGQQVWVVVDSRTRNDERLVMSRPYKKEKNARNRAAVLNQREREQGAVG